MQQEASYAGWTNSSAQGLLQAEGPALKLSVRSRRDSELRPEQIDGRVVNSGSASQLVVGDVDGNSTSRTWRSLVQAHSEAALAAAVPPEQLRSASRSPVATSTGQVGLSRMDLDPAARTVGSPSVLAGRLTPNGVVSSRNMESRLGGIPRPQRLGGSTSGLAPSGPSPPPERLRLDAPNVSTARQVVPGPAPAAAGAAAGRISDELNPLAASAADLRRTPSQPSRLGSGVAATGANAPAGTVDGAGSRAGGGGTDSRATGSGWRASVAGMMTLEGGEGEVASRSRSKLGPDSRASSSGAPTRSLWRSITQSFAASAQPLNTGPGAPPGDSAPRGLSRDGAAAAAAPSFRSPAVLCLADSPPGPDHNRQPFAASAAGRSSHDAPDSPTVGDRSQGARGRSSRTSDAADRAVREVDAEAAADKAARGTGSGNGYDSAPGGGSESEGASLGSPQRSASRRLRFTTNNLDSANSSFARSLSRGSRSQSFKDRVASALGLGGLLGRRSRETSMSGEATPGGATLQRVHSVLKKEGTSKQLRLGLALDGSDGDGIGGSGEEGSDAGSAGRRRSDMGYRAAKAKASVAVGDGDGGSGRGSTSGALARSRSGQLGSGGLAAAEPGGRGGAKAGLSRADSMVVPARLLVNRHGTELQGQDLEATLLSPSALLPPGETLPAPFRRGLLAKAPPSRNGGAAGDGDSGSGAAAAAAAAPASPGLSRGTTQGPLAREGLSTGVSFVGSRAATGVRWGSADGADPSVHAAAGGGGGGSVPESVGGSVAGSVTAQGRGEPLAAAGAGASAAPRTRSTIKLPIITTGHWDSLVFSTVWRVGRVFGFQAFNVRPGTEADPKREYVPASIFVAADHLIQLLVKNGYVRRHRGDDSDDERFAKALFEFHSTIFYGYEMQWAKMQRLSPRVQRFTDDLRERLFSDHHIINGLLSELALYFLIYTESANLRFCSEAMWMIFWCMNHSYIMTELWSRGSPDRLTGARDRLPQLRNTHQHMVLDLQAQIHVRPADMRPEDCGKLSSILSRLASSDLPPSDRELLADLVSYGDGGFFMDRVVTPIFFVMSYEIDHLATLGVDTAHRLGYDDFNESLNCREVVYNALLDLRVSPADITTGTTNDAYHSLTSLGFQGRAVINKFDPQVAAEWWRHRVFVKTYRERRSWWGVYRAFYRVYAFHLVLFHLMQAQAFAGWNWRVVSSAVLTHAWLRWLERVANWMMTMPTPEPLQTTMTKVFDRKGFFKMDKVQAVIDAREVRRRENDAGGRNRERLKHMKTHQARSASDFAGPVKPPTVRQIQAMQPERVLEIEGAPLFGLFGGLVEWLILATSLSAFYAIQFSYGFLRDICYRYWGYVAAGYTGAHLVHFLLTTRDGYVISLSQTLHLPSYFQNFSVRPMPRTWMYLPMRTNYKNFFSNVMFWLMVLSMKIPFDYFVIHKPIVKPIKLLLTRNWLGCEGTVYRLGHLTLPCIGGDWILVAARLFPFVIVALFDTALFYQFTVTAFGIYHGLIKLDLGVISTWEDLVREFHKSPPRWWMRCMSFTGNENQKNLLFNTISANSTAGPDGSGGGAGGGGGEQVAVSDGLMFKIKIVTPEEIKAKHVGQGLMLKERKINMQAGKGPVPTEVESRGGVSRPTTAGTRTAGASTAATTNAPRTSTFKLAAAAAVSGATSTRLATAAAAGASSASPAQVTGVRTRSMRPGAHSVALVGQDFKEAPTRPAGAGLFSWRSQGHGQNAGGGSVPTDDAGVLGGGMATAIATTRRGSATGIGGGAAPAAGGGRRGSVEGMAPGAAPAGAAGFFGSLRSSMARPVGAGAAAAAGGAAQPPLGSGGPGGPAAAAGPAASGGGGGGVSGVIRAFSRKSNQVHPGGAVAESLEYDSATDFTAASPFRSSLLRARASLDRNRGGGDGGSTLIHNHHQRRRAPHPAWQPEELLGPYHADYDPDADPMSATHGSLGSGPMGLQYYVLDSDWEQRGRRQWRLWPWRKRPRGRDQEGGPTVPGPALASLRVVGNWASAVGEVGREDAWGAPPQPGEADEEQQGQSRRGGAGRRVPIVPKALRRGYRSDGGGGGDRRTRLQEGRAVRRRGSVVTLDSGTLDTGSAAAGATTLGCGGDADAGRNTCGGGGGRGPQQVYRGPLGEGMILLGPDGRPIPDAPSDSEQEEDPSGEGDSRDRPSPLPHVLLAEVPVVLLESNGMEEPGDLDEVEELGLDRDSGGRGSPRRGQSGAGSKGGFSQVEMGWSGQRHSGGGGGGPLAQLSSGPSRRDSDGGGGGMSGSRTGTVRFISGDGGEKHRGMAMSTIDEYGDIPSPSRMPKSALKTAKKKSSRGSGGFLASLFKPKSGNSTCGDGLTDDDLEDNRGGGGGDRSNHWKADTSRRGGVGSGAADADASVRGGHRSIDTSVRNGGRKSLDIPTLGPAAAMMMDASVRRGGGGDGGGRRGDTSVRGGGMFRGGAEGSVRGGRIGAGMADRSVRGDRSVRAGAVGPAAARLGVQRTRSISAATSTNFEQKHFAKTWERQHSIAAQVMKKDLVTRTTSMVLLGTDHLEHLEADELDVVSEQMMMWSSFAEAWDAICDDLREDDLISDKESDLLKFVRLESSGKLHGLRPILLPTFFFAGQIRKVIDTGRVTTSQIMVLTEFRVLITWLACQLGLMSGKHAHVIMTTALYGGIINVKHIGLRKRSFESTIRLIGLVEAAVRTREVPFDIKEFADHLLIILSGLESECYAVQKMWELGRLPEDELEGALTMFEVVQDMQARVRSNPEDLKQCLKRAVAMEDITTNTNVLLQVTTVLRQMLTTTSADATPQGEEAQRVLEFFINSLGHPSLDKPENLEFMLSWSVLTPAYEEDVLYAVDAGLAAEELGLPKKKITDLLSETDDGFTLMAYLRAMFPSDWINFKERMRRLVGRQTEITDWGQVTELDFGPGGLLFDFRTDLQLWASYRGQLLARTVRGMMCYERALKVLCRMEYPTPMGISDQDYERWVNAMVASKFEYVVAVQTYGRNSKSNDLRLRQLAQGVDVLVQRFPALKVAYLDDAVDPDRYGPTQFSVLIRNRRASDPIVDPTRPFGRIVEAYRIRLPYNRYSNRGVVLGEGKPENQNHASVFAFNEGLQAIDMNQDNYLAEALKMRNLLSELHPSNKGSYLLFADDTPGQVLSPHMTAAELRFVILSRMKRAFPTAIVGFREWIFSANTGALGQYAAATEYAFATIQSRIMTKPARVRMHYGHPDVFNKTHIMTRGGMSKGTRTLHISEDYFIGAAHTLRGARIRYKEYISCGKGRDMGFDSILGYQKKISGGAGDLATSREVHRLGTRLDFFRLMSFYHGGIGHFLNSYLTLAAAWYNIWALLLTAMAGAMELGLRGEAGQVTLTQTYNVQQVLQLGTLAIIPYVGQLILETGLLRTMITVFGQVVTGSLFFYIFQQQTVAASFSTVMAYGGMRYIGTGRGFSIQTTDFVCMYTTYARTHLYLGFEVLFFVATLYSLPTCSSCNYAALTWNSWLLAFVLLLCPLWFNPFIFHLSKVQRDFMAWKRWLHGDMDAGTGTNWFTWNRDQLAKARNDDGNVTDAWRNAAREVVGTCLPYGLLALAMVSQVEFRVLHGIMLDNPYLEFLVVSSLMWGVALGTSYIGHYLLERAKSKEWRIVRYCLTLFFLLMLVLYLAVLSRFYIGDGFDHLMQVGYANLVFLIMIHKAATFTFTQNNAVRDFVDSGYYLMDVLVGFAMFAVLALLSFVGFVSLLQSKLLFNEAFSQSVQTARIKMQVKRSGKQIKRKSRGMVMTMEEWMRSRPASAATSVAAPSLAATVYDGAGVSRAVSLAPSAVPSFAPSFAPSAMTSAAPSAFTSAANSRGTSRRESMSEMTAVAVAVAGGEGGQQGGGGGSGDHVASVQPRVHRQAAPYGDDDDDDLLAGLQPPDAVGLRERRLRFG